MYIPSICGTESPYLIFSSLDLLVRLKYNDTHAEIIGRYLIFKHGRLTIARGNTVPSGYLLRS